METDNGIQEAKADLILMDEIAEIGHINGDLHDEDSGAFFANLKWPSDSANEEDKEMKLPPAKLSLYIDGYWYVYNMHARYKEGETNGKEEK